MAEYCTPPVILAIESDLFDEINRYALIGVNLDCRLDNELFIFECMRKCPEETAFNTVRSYSAWAPTLFAMNKSGTTPLLSAANRGFRSVTLELLAFGANYTVRDNRMRSVMHFGAPWPSVMRGLLTRMPAWAVRQHLQWRELDGGNQPLHLALQARQTDSASAIMDRAQQLLFAAELVKAANDAGERPIHLNSDLELLRTLFEQGSDCLWRTNLGALPVHTVASLSGSAVSGALQLAFVETDRKTQLGFSMTATDFRGRVPLHWAAEYGDADNVRWLLEQGADARVRDKQGDLALQLGLRNEHFHLVPLFDKAAEGFPPLIAGVALGSLDVVMQLVQRGVDPDAIDVETGRSALFEAAERGLSEVAGYLLSVNASLTRTDAQGVSVLGSSVLANQPDMAQYLISKGAPVMQRMRNFSTALHLAAVAGNREVVSVLVDAGADVQALDFKSRSALHFVSTREAAEGLLLAGANATRSSEFGLLPLHSAALDSRSEALEVLLSSRQSEVNALDFQGNTALHHAAAAGSDAAVRVLLQWCADTQIANHKGLLPNELSKDARIRALANGDLPVASRCDCDCGNYAPGAMYGVFSWNAGCEATIRCRFGSEGGPSSEQLQCQRNELASVSSNISGVWEPASPSLRCRSPVAGAHLSQGFSWKALLLGAAVGSRILWEAG